jgi:hypothetical protein
MDKYIQKWRKSLINSTNSNKETSKCEQNKESILETDKEQEIHSLRRIRIFLSVDVCICTSFCIMIFEDLFL